MTFTDTLLDKLNSNLASVRNEALEALHESSESAISTEIIACLRKLKTTADNKERSLIDKILANVEARHVNKNLSIEAGSTLEELLPRILETTDSKAAIGILNQIQGPREAILPFFIEILNKDKDPVVLSWLAKKIGRTFPDQEAIQSLLPLLRHNDARVVANVIEIIQEIGSPAAYIIIVQMLRRPEPRIQASALTALAKWDKDFAIRALTQMLQATHKASFAIAACHAMSQLGLYECLPLIEPLKDHPVIGDAARVAINSLTSSRIEPGHSKSDTASTTSIQNEPAENPSESKTVIEKDSDDYSENAKTLIDCDFDRKETAVTLIDKELPPQPSDEAITEFQGWTVISKFPAVGAEADLFLVQKAEAQAVLKLYHRKIVPKSEIIDRLTTLSHEFPELLQILDSGIDTDTKRFFELQEYFSEGSLADVLSKKTIKLEEEDVRILLTQLTRSLAILHDNEIHHLDIKPANIMLRSHHPLQFVLIDFGIASLLGKEFSMWATVRQGTPMYQSPESIAGIIGEKIDWWSVGMVILEILSGQHPFEGIQKQLIYFNVINGKIPIPETLPKKWKNLIKGLLTVNPEKRWGGAKISDWLKGVDVTDDDDSENDPPSPPPPPKPEFKKPITFQRKKYYDRQSLFEAFIASSEAWKKAVELLGRGNLSRWFEENQCFEEAQAILKIFESQDSADWGLFEVIYTFAPTLPLCWKGQLIDDAFVLHKFRGILTGTLQPGKDEFSEILCSTRLVENYLRFTKKEPSDLSELLTVLYCLLVSCSDASPQIIAESFIWLVSKPIADQNPFELLKKAIDGEAAQGYFLKIASRKGMAQVALNLGVVKEIAQPVWQFVFSLWGIISNLPRSQSWLKELVKDLLPDDSEDMNARLAAQESRWAESGGSLNASEDGPMDCFRTLAFLKSPFSSRQPFVELRRALIEKDHLANLLFNMLAVGKEFQDIVFSEETNTRTKNDWVLACLILRENHGLPWVVRAVEFFVEKQTAADFSYDPYKKLFAAALQTKSHSEAYQLFLGAPSNETMKQPERYAEFLQSVFRLPAHVELKTLAKVINLFQNQQFDHSILPGFIRRIISGGEFSEEQLVAAVNLVESKELLQKDLVTSFSEPVVENIEDTVFADGFSYDEACMLRLVPFLQRILQLRHELLNRTGIGEKSGAPTPIKFPTKHGIPSCALGCSLPMLFLSLLVSNFHSIFWGLIALTSAYYFFEAGPFLSYKLTSWKNKLNGVFPKESGLPHISTSSIEEEIRLLRDMVTNHIQERTICTDAHNCIFELKGEAEVRADAGSWNNSYRMCVGGTIASVFLMVSLAVIFFIPSSLFFGVPLYGARKQGRDFKGFANVLGIITLLAGIVAYGLTLQYFNTSLKSFDANGLQTCLALGVDGNLSEPLPDGNTYLIMAIRQNNLDMVKLLAKEGYGLNTGNLRKKRPLHFTVENMDLEATSILVDYGADVNSKTDTGLTPLHLATRNSDVSTIEFLLKKGANIDSEDQKRNRPLHLGTEVNNKIVVDFLLKNKAGVNMKNAEGLTPIFYAVENGNIEIVKALLARGAEINIFDQSGRTPFLMAIAKENLPLIQSLVDSGASINSEEETDACALAAAISTGNKDIFKYVWSLKPKISIASLKEAMQTNDELALKLFAIYRKSQPTQTNLNRLLAIAVEFGSINFVEVLIGAGAKVNSLVSSGFISGGMIKNKIRDFEIVPFLIKNGVGLRQSSFDDVKSAILTGDETRAAKLTDFCYDVNHKEKNEANKTLLHYAAEKGQLSVVKALIERGADITAEWGSWFKETPMKTARNNRHPELIPYLTGLPLHLAVVEGKLKKVRDEISKKPSIVNTPDLEGKSPLHLAAYAGKTEIANALIVRGALVDQKDPNGTTPLILASDQGHVDIVRLLLDSNADVNAAGQYETTPLQRAAQNGHLSVVLLLLDRGARLETRWVNAIQLAEQNKHHEIATILRQHFGK
ncbi:hypothetical protein MASR1M12_31470 [Erysipelotrichia bacterium]